MVETRSSSKSDSRVTPSTTKKRKKTATNFTVKVSKSSRKTAKKATSTKNARTSPKPNLVTEFDLVREHYALLCAREYCEANEGRHPSMKFLIEKQAEFLKLDEKKQLEITEKYKAESKKNKNKKIEEADSQLHSGPVTELVLVQVYYAERYRKEYMADNGGKEPPIEVLDAKQSEFFNMTHEDKMKIRKDYLADKKKREREENARTSPKPNLVTELDLVKEHYALLCAREYREANEGRHPSMKFLIEKQAEFLKLDEKDQMKIRKEYLADKEKRKREEF